MTCECVCVLYGEESRVFASAVWASCTDHVSDQFSDYDWFL